MTMASAYHRLTGVAGTILIHHQCQSAEQAAAESSAWRSGLGVWPQAAAAGRGGGVQFWCGGCSLHLQAAPQLRNRRAPSGVAGAG